MYSKYIFEHKKKRALTNKRGKYIKEKHTNTLHRTRLHHPSNVRAPLFGGVG
jgi:hypothetical protein